jgi:hypothetical protein
MTTYHALLKTATTLRLVVCIAIGFAFVLHGEDSMARRKTRTGRYTATDVQLFNPNFANSAATLEWIDAAGALQASLPVSMPLRSSVYITAEESGLVSPTFIGAIEIVSATEALYGVVTHMDKGAGAPAFERGNDQYEIRDVNFSSDPLNAPLIVENGVVHTNLSLLSPADNGPTLVTITLFTSAGTPITFNQTIVGNVLVEISPTIVTSTFAGSGRIWASQPIAVYVSLYDGAVQGGYTAVPGDEASVSAVNGVYPNLQPTDDAGAQRTLYVVNTSDTPTEVTISSNDGVLFTRTVPTFGQVDVSVPFSKTITEVYVNANQEVESVMTVADTNASDPRQITGFVVYPLLKKRDEALPRTKPLGLTTYCAVAPTVYGGYKGWETTLKVINPLSVTGLLTVTFFPALSATTQVSNVIVTRLLPPNLSVVPNYAGIVGGESAWSALLEASVPFYGDATSLRRGETDGLMSYRVEPIACPSRTYNLYVPLHIKPATSMR